MHHSATARAHAVALAATSSRYLVALSTGDQNDSLASRCQVPRPSYTRSQMLRVKFNTGNVYLAIYNSSWGRNILPTVTIAKRFDFSPRLRRNSLPSYGTSISSTTGYEKRSKIAISPSNGQQLATCPRTV